MKKIKKAIVVFFKKYKDLAKESIINFIVKILADLLLYLKTK